jgi:two-component system, NtrC family, sensor kinase
MAKIFITILLSLCYLFASTQQLYTVKSTQSQLLGNYIYSYTDNTNNLTYNSIEAISNWQQAKTPVLNCGLTQGTVWLKLPLLINDTAHKYLLKLANALTNNADIYYKDSMGNWHTIKAGDNFVFKQRKYNNISYLYDLPTHFKQGNIYFKISNHEQCQVALSIGPRQQILTQENSIENFLLICFTIVLVMFCYNLFIYFSVKDNTYLYYSIYILCIGITQIALHGYAFKILWPNNIWLQQHSTFIFSAATGITSLLFFKQFVGKSNISKAISRSITAVNIGYCLVVILSIFNIYSISYLLLQVLALLATTFVLVGNIIAIKKGVRSASFYLIAWLVFIVGIAIFVLKDFDILPYNNITIYTMTVGSALEVILLSFALANRIKILQRDKEQSQQLLVESLQKNEAYITEENTRLDEKVKQQTQKLEDAYAELQRRQVELISKEKMSSLGVLTAGIAHEINNPINFITSSIRPLRKDVDRLLSIINLFDNQQQSDAQIVQHGKELYQALDIPYIKEEVQQLFEGIDEGALRTANIVKGFQSFARTESKTYFKADLLEGIENTLILLNTFIKNQITVIKQLEPIPQYSCSIGSINQVFLNIINNAIHAVQDNQRAEKYIWISSSATPQQIKIVIKDNGNGIPTDVKQKIFDPFFTTKDVGKGTGLGLSISTGIIQEHGGQLLCNSVIGEGTEFTILLPLLNE